MNIFDKKVMVVEADDIVVFEGTHDQWRVAVRRMFYSGEVLEIAYDERRSLHLCLFTTLDIQFK